MKLKNKVALITGGASGFGRETALLFASEGAKIVIVDMNEKKLSEVKDEIEKNGGEVLALCGNVTVAEDVQTIVTKTIEKFKQIDILFNNAGIFRPGNVEDMSIKDWNDVINVNLNSLFLMTKYCIKYLKETKGNIISTSSAGGIIGFPDAISYAASKGGVISFAKAVAVDFAKFGVRSNIICPGTSTTGMTKEALEIKEVYDGYLAPIPLKRFGTTKDIAYAALYLASDEASYLTGVVIPVDGGWTMS